ncbi:MAG: hypothetical protein QW660_08505 [Candidatus Bathyarchaeia archaeon]
MKRLCMPFAFVNLLFLLTWQFTITIVHAGTTLSIPYTVFNSATPLYYKVENAYNCFEAKITLNITFTSDNAEGAIALGFFNDNSSSKCGLLLKIYRWPIDVFYVECDSKTRVASVLGSEGGWESRVGNVLYVAFDGERFYIGNITEKGLIVDVFPLGRDWMLRYVQASDFTALDNTLTSGYVVIEFEAAEMSENGFFEFLTLLIFTFVVLWFISPFDFLKVLLLLLLILVAFLIQPPSTAQQTKPLDIMETESYIVIMTYSQPEKLEERCTTIRLNSTKQRWIRNWLSLAKQMGFKGVGVAELECYYLDGFLDEYLRLIGEYGLKAALYIMWRDFTINVSFEQNAPRPIPNEFWMPKDFPDNSTKVSAWLSFIRNVTEIAKNHQNVEFYLLFMPFKWGNDATTQANFENSTYYRNYMQHAVNIIKQTDPDKPVLLVSDGIEIENVNLALRGLIPYNLEGINGYGFTYYNRAKNRFSRPLFQWITEFYRRKIDEFLGGKGYLFLAEWGWQTSNKEVYGYCLEEASKCALIEETTQAISDFHIQHWGYFSLQDFPSENATFGLAYLNFTLKPSGKIMQKLLKKG